MMFCAQYDSPLGPLTLRSNGMALTSLGFGPCIEKAAGAGAFEGAFRWLDAYFQGRECALPVLALGGSHFQQLVWHGCLGIPRGQTCTYGALAKAVGCPRGARAVGAALARNPLLIIVPCHRVLPASGGIGAYAAGACLKQHLLQWERIDISTALV